MRMGTSTACRAPSTEALSGHPPTQDGIGNEATRRGMQKGNGMPSALNEALSGPRRPRTESGTRRPVELSRGAPLCYFGFRGHFG